MTPPAPVSGRDLDRDLLKGLGHRLDCSPSAYALGMGHPGLLALALMPLAPVMGAHRMEDARHRQVEGVVIVGKAREARRGEGHPVIALDPRNDALLFGLSEGVRPVAQELDDRIVRL